MAFFLELDRSPLTVNIGKDLVLKVRRFTLDDILAWARELHMQQIEKTTKNMTDIEKREYETFYRSIPPDLQQMKAQLRTADGIKRIIRECFKDAQVFDRNNQERPKLTLAQIDKILNVNGTGRLSGLAIVLADLDEQSVLQPTTGDDGEEKERRDPLARSARSESKSSQETGGSTSRSSSNAMDSTPAD